MTTEKKMTKYDRNFKFNVSYEEVDVEEVKEEEPVEMEVHDAPKKQVAFTQLWKAWEFKYASDYTISKAAAQRWLKAYPAFFASAECAADSLRDYVVELMKED